MPTNSNGGLDHMVDLYEVCAAVAYQQIEVAAWACLPGTIRWSQKQPKRPLEGHDRRRNLVLLLRPRNQTALLSGCYFQDVSEIQEVTNHSRHDSKMSVQTVHPAVAEMLDPSHQLGRGLLWRWQWQPITNISIYFVINSVRELFDTLSYTILYFFLLVHWMVIRKVSDGIYTVYYFVHIEKCQWGRFFC
jgi:hypothetical protein